MKKSKLLYLMATLVIGVCLLSCNNDDTPAQNLYYDVATLVSSQNNVTVCEVQQDGDSPVATYTFTNAQLNTNEWAPGCRLLIAYTLDNSKPYETGNGNLYGWGYVYTPTLTEGTSESTSSWSTEVQNLLQIWRTGKWINIISSCTYSDKHPDVYKVVADAETLDSEYPVVRVIYESDKNAGAETQYLYTSVDIESLWERPNAKGIRFTILDITGAQSFVFEKQ